MQNDDNFPYYAPGSLVYIGDLAFTLDEIWIGVDHAERAGVPLNQIGRALTHNWTACVGALARKNIVTLRVLITETQP
jgi:hypothetical protein